MSYPPRPRIQTSSNSPPASSQTAAYPFAAEYQRGSMFSPSTTVVDFPNSAHPLAPSAEEYPPARPRPRFANAGRYSSHRISAFESPLQPKRHQYLSIYEPELEIIPGGGDEMAEPVPGIYDPSRTLAERPRSKFRMFIRKFTQQPRVLRLREWFTTMRVLNILFGVMAAFIAASGIAMTAVALMWLYPYTTNPLLPTEGNHTYEGFDLSQAVSLLTVVLPNTQMISSLVLGVLLITIFFLCIPAIVSRKVNGLVLLNLFLTVSTMLVLVGASMIWWRSLRPRMQFWDVWAQPTAETAVVRAAIEVAFDCCGYWSSSNLTEIVRTDSCPTAEIAMTKIGCVDPFGAYAQKLVTTVFTFLYAVAGLMSIWVLVNACIISERNLQERFRLIDRKHESGEEGLRPIYQGSDTGHGGGSSNGHSDSMKKKKALDLPSPPSSTLGHEHGRSRGIHTKAGYDTLSPASAASPSYSNGGYDKLSSLSPSSAKPRERTIQFASNSEEKPDLSRSVSAKYFRDRYAQYASNKQPEMMVSTTPVTTYPPSSFASPTISVSPPQHMYQHQEEEETQMEMDPYGGYEDHDPFADDRKAESSQGHGSSEGHGSGSSHGHGSNMSHHSSTRRTPGGNYGAMTPNGGLTPNGSNVSLARHQSGSSSGHSSGTDGRRAGLKRSQSTLQSSTMASQGGSLGQQPKIQKLQRSLTTSTRNQL